MAQARASYSLQQLFDLLFDAFNAVAAPTYAGDRHLVVETQPDIAGYPAVCLGIMSATVSNRVMTVCPIAWRGPGTEMTEAILMGECHAGVYLQLVGPDHYHTGWMTSIIAPGIADALSSIFGVTVSWSNTYRTACDPGLIYVWDFFVGEIRIGSWVFEYFGPTDPVVADPYRPGFNLTWAYPNVGALHYRGSAGSDQNADDGSSGGGGGGGSTDVSILLEPLNRLADETARVADQRHSLSVNSGKSIYHVQPSEVITVP